MIRSFGYLLREGIRNLWCNRLMSMASVGVLIACMLLSGGSVLLSINVASLLERLESNNLIMVYLDDNVSTLEAVKIGEEINQVANVTESQLVTNDEALEDLMQNIEGVETLLEELEQDNPLPHAYRVTIEDLEKYDITRNRLEALEGVQSVRGESDVSEQIIRFENVVNGTLIWIIVLLVMVSLFIITNTIRVTLFNRRKEISVMKSVGATDWFIRVPFIVEGILIGIISGIVTTFLLQYIYNHVNWGDTSLMGYGLLPFENYIMLFAAAFVIVGVVFGAIGGVISIGRYLRSEGGDLYE